MQRLDEKFGFEGIIYASKKMQNVIDRLRRIAATDATVLITGENGTGKEVIAQAIHQNSPRRNKRIVAINTGAIAENLVESELFGHVKGSFTDAVSDREGAFQYANGGTLFLDEIGDMPVALQVKLLRVLQERKVRPLGSNRDIDIDVRIISATHRDLPKAMARGENRTSTGPDRPRRYPSKSHSVEAIDRVSLREAANQLSEDERKARVPCYLIDPRRSLFVALWD